MEVSMNRFPLLVVSSALCALGLATPTWSQAASNSDHPTLLSYFAKDQITPRLESSDALAALLGPRSQNPKGKEIFDSYSSAVGTVNPVAAALFKGTGEFLDICGYFGKAADPVGDAIKRITERLDAIELRMTALEAAVKRVQNDLFQTQNLARIRKLRDFKDRLLGILDRLQPAAKDRNEKIALARDAQRIAEKFLFDVDKDLWIWSDLVMKDHSWQNKAMVAGQLLEPDFKPWPTMEYYTLALVTWMTAAEYASEGDAAWVKQTFGDDIQKHIALLTVRPGWTAESGPPETLPEEVRSRVKGWFVPDKYPDNLVCHFHEYTTDQIGRQIKFVYSYEYPAKSSDELCTVPAGFWNNRTDAEETLERTYGADLMWTLANRLQRLRDYGTVREQFIGTFAAAGPTIVPAFIYAVRPDGRMIWQRHDGVNFGLDRWVGGNTVSQGWGDFSEVIPGGGNIILAMSQGGAVAWYRHNGFNTGAVDVPGHITGASNLSTGTAPSGEPTLDALAVRGEDLSKADPLASVLRSRQADDSARRGFDIGMAVAEGHTAPGPGKDARGKTLPVGEQAGYATAVAFSIERNLNAGFAATGAAIAKMDPTVEAARTADPDVFAWLGFDIATGIFGDPNLGAKGNTATGPGSLKIRDALSAAGQRGFNAAVKFHLARKYKPVPIGSAIFTPIAKDNGSATNKFLEEIAKGNAGAKQWDGGREVGTGWGYKQVFSGGNGVVYVITDAGKLMFYRHTGHKDGAKVWEPAKEVGSGWGDYKTVFSGGDGFIYAVTQEGKLLWYNHLGFGDGSRSWAPVKEITTIGNDNWASYTHVFSAGPRYIGNPTLDKMVIYAIDGTGNLYWYGQSNWTTGRSFLGARKLVGTGWGDYTQVFALLPDASDIVR